MDLLKRNRKIKATVSSQVLDKFYNKYPKEKVVCKAPFTSLYFYPNGEVGACCLNRSKYIYGTYNKDSIKNIIKSDLRKQHQKYLKANNFSLGCDVCENSLEAQNYSGLLANIFQEFTIKDRIERIDFELSNHCNFDCIMCLIDKSYKESSIYNDSFFTEIKPILKKIKFVNFLGGEPFLIPIYYKIWDYLIANNKKCMITIQSNGSIYNERIEKLLQNRNFQVGVSIDTIDADKFTEIRKKSSLETVMKNIKKFAEFAQSKGSFLQISVCPMRINYKDITNIIEFANKNNYLIFYNQVFYPKHLNIRDLDVDSLKNIIEYYTNFCVKLTENSIVEKANKTAFTDLINVIELWKNNAEYRLKNAQYITNKELNNIILMSCKDISEDIKQCIEKIMFNLPDKILCSKQQIEEIKNIDSSNFFNIDCSDDNRFNNLLREVKDYFNLN